MHDANDDCFMESEASHYSPMNILQYMVVARKRAQFSCGCLNNDHSIIFHHKIAFKIIHRFIRIQNDRNNITATTTANTNAKESPNSCLQSSHSLSPAALA